MMGKVVDDRLRLVLLAAMAWAWEHDYPGEHSMHDEYIEPQALCEAIDWVGEEHRLEGA